MKLKVTATEVGGKPSLIFTAIRALDVGEEFLFDYNDKESRLSFLKSYPVCSNTGLSLVYFVTRDVY